MELGNHFENLASQQMAVSAKRRHAAAERRAAKSIAGSDADAPMVGNAMEQARDERNAQLGRYRRHKAQERDDLCHGTHGREVSALVALMKTVTIDDADKLIAAVLGAKWLREVDLNTRHSVLSMVGDLILRLRIRSGLSPFDDAIGDAPPTAFQIIRHGLMGV